MSSGATLGRKLFTKAETTLNKLGIQEAVLLLIVPQQHLSTAERLLKDYVIRSIYGRTNEKLDQNDLVFAPRLREPTLVLKAKKKYKALHDILRSYGIKEIAVLAI
jgi:DNA polymerase III psi subunit